MREGWKSETLGSVCQIKPPKREAKQKLADSDPVSFVPMNDLGQRQKDLALNDERPLNKVVGSYTYFADNDVLLAKITPCFENGKLGIARNLTNGVGFGSSEYIVFRSTGDIDPEYLFYFLSQDSFRDAGARVMTGAVGHKRVPKEFIENYPIPVPSRIEQKRIVAVLDEVFEEFEAVAANTEKNLANARELYENYLNTLFTQKDEEWVETTLGAVAEFKNGLNYTKGSKGEKVKIVGVKDFQSNYWVPMDELDAVQIDGVLSESYVLQKNDILTVRSNGNKQLIGRCILADDVPEKISHSGFTIRVRIYSSTADPAYLVHYLKSGAVHGMLVNSGGGINISSLNQKTLSTLPVLLPERSAQSKIVTRIESIKAESDKLVVIYQKKLAVLGELKQSILRKAFAGGLTAEDASIKKEAIA